MRAASALLDASLSVGAGFDPNTDPRPVVNRMRLAPAAIRMGMGTGPLLRWGRYVAVAAMLAVLAAMAGTPELAAQLYASLGCLGVVLAAASITRRRA